MGNVAGGAQLRVGAREVEGKLAVRNGHGAGDPREGPQFVTAQEILRRIPAFRQRGDGGVEAALGEGEVGFQRGLEEIRAVAFDQGGDGAYADMVRCQLRVQIPFPLLRRALAKQYDLEDIARQLARAHEAHRR